MASCSLRGAVRCALSRARPSAAQSQRADGRPKGRRGRWRRATSSFRPTRCGRSPNGLQVVAVLHHEQPAVSMRLLVRAGSASDPSAKLGLAQLAGVAARSGDGDEVGAADRRRDRLHRRRHGHRRRHRPELRQHGRDEGQLRKRHADAVRHGAATRRSRTEEIDRQRQQALSACR